MTGKTLRKDRKTIIMLTGYSSEKTGTTLWSHQLGSRLSQYGYRVIFPINSPSRVIQAFRMLEAILRAKRETSITLINLFSGRAFIWAEAVGFLLRMLAKPYVTVLHGGNLPKFFRKNQKRVDRLLLGANHVIAPSKFLRDSFSKSNLKIDVVPNSIELRRYKYVHRCNPKPKIVWLRAFHSVYNPQLVPRVICELKNRYPEISVKMAGPEKDESFGETVEIAKNTGTLAHISFSGFLPNEEIPGLLNESDIFLNTTRIDNTPISVIEAMACGLCVISTNVGGMPYLLSDEEDALLIPSNDFRAAAMAITRILSEPGLAGKLSQAARAKAAEFDWEVTLPKWESIFMKSEKDEVATASAQINN